MKRSARSEREAQIQAAAYEVLQEKDYAGASMLAIARRAKASNETLYNWYGDKQGLFAAMVRANAETIRQDLEHLIDTSEASLQALENLGQSLLSMVLGERAILLNQAAVASGTNDLGAVIASQGRSQLFPLLVAYMEEAKSRDPDAFGDHAAPQLVEWYLALLIGDLQIRRAIGVLPVPDAAFVQMRAAQAFDGFKRLCR